jgi:putative PIN family toxin of toxin-antitoxin system
MIKVVIDTNVVVSANLVDAGPSAAIFQLATNKKIQMCISPAVLAEYEKVLRRPRLKLDPAKITDALALIRATSQLVDPTTTLKISGDEADNRFYECTDAAAADYLITGNTQDFSKDHGPTRIITPRNFIDIIVPQLLKY